jgi:hypothetical protein
MTTGETFMREWKWAKRGDPPCSHPKVESGVLPVYGNRTLCLYAMRRVREAVNIVVLYLVPL